MKEHIIKIRLNTLGVADNPIWLVETEDYNHLGEGLSYTSTADHLGVINYFNLKDRQKFFNTLKGEMALRLEKKIQNHQKQLESLRRLELPE